MFAIFIYIFFSSLQIIPKKRIFHYLLSQIAFISSFCYLMMANDVLTIKNDSGRNIYNAKYIDWIIVTPTQMVILGKIGKLTNSNIYALCFLCIMMILSGWIGDLVESLFKWVFLFVGCITLYPIYIFLFEDFDIQVVKEFSGEYIANKYYWIGRLLILVWLFYPVVWIMDNINFISNVNFACISNTIFDFFSKVLFTIWIYICVINSPYRGEQIQLE
jgi:bacteriorhodopsin